MGTSSMQVEAAPCARQPTQTPFCAPATNPSNAQMTSQAPSPIGTTWWGTNVWRIPITARRWQTTQGSAHRVTSKVVPTTASPTTRSVWSAHRVGVPLTTLTHVLARPARMGTDSPTLSALPAVTYTVSNVMQIRQNVRLVIGTMGWCLLLVWDAQRRTV